MKIENCDRCDGEMVLVGSGVWYPVYAVKHKYPDNGCLINSGYYETKEQALVVWSERNKKRESE